MLWYPGWSECVLERRCRACNCRIGAILRCSAECMHIVCTYSHSHNNISSVAFELHLRNYPVAESPLSNSLTLTVLFAFLLCLTYRSKARARCAPSLLLPTTRTACCHTCPVSCNRSQPPISSAKALPYLWSLATKEWWPEFHTVLPVTHLFGSPAFRISASDLQRQCSLAEHVESSHISKQTVA